MKNIEFSNCMQVIGIIGILPNRVCGRARSNISMDLQFSNNFPSETEKLGYVHFEGGDNDGIDNINGFDPGISFLGTDMLKWFNHQSVDNSIFFSVGRNFPQLVVCIVPEHYITESEHNKFIWLKQRKIMHVPHARFSDKLNCSC